MDVPLHTPDDRAEFIAILRRAASSHGFNVDAATPAEIDILNKVSPMSVNATVWWGNDEEVVASAMDGIDHLGRVWLSFEQGTDRRSFSAFRARLWPILLRRWPEARSLPITPTGAIPLPADLVRTAEGYKVKPMAEACYVR